MNDAQFDSPEHAACFPREVELAHFNPNAQLPYGLTIEHMQSAMNEFIDFIGFINQQLYTRKIQRLGSGPINGIHSGVGM